MTLLYNVLKTRLSGTPVYHRGKVTPFETVQYTLDKLKEVYNSVVLSFVIPYPSGVLVIFKLDTCDQPVPYVPVVPLTRYHPVIVVVLMIFRVWPAVALKEEVPLVDGVWRTVWAYNAVHVLTFAVICTYFATTYPV